MWELRLKLKTISVVAMKTVAHKVLKWKTAKISVVALVTALVTVADPVGVVDLVMVVPVTVALATAVPVLRCLLPRPATTLAKAPSKALGVTKVAVR